MEVVAVMWPFVAAGIRKQGTISQLQSEFKKVLATGMPMHVLTCSTPHVCSHMQYSHGCSHMQYSHGCSQMQYARAATDSLCSTPAPAPPQVVYERATVGVEQINEYANTWTAQISTAFWSRAGHVQGQLKALLPI